MAKTHGMSRTLTYRIWATMIQRCENPNDRKYKYYGGRGISVCEHWHKFENFCADMGVKPEGMTLDRMNNNGNYRPRNCRWTTYKEQNNNCRPKSCGLQKQRWFRAWCKDKMCQFFSNNQNKFAKQHGLNRRCIGYCLRGKQKIHKGWIFRLVESN